MKPSKSYAQVLEESKPQSTFHSFSSSNPEKPSFEFTSVFQTVADPTKEIKQLCDWNMMIQAYRKLKEKLLKCKTNAEKFMALMDITNQLDVSLPYSFVTRDLY